jgi:hypothetical protein
LWSTFQQNRGLVTYFLRDTATHLHAWADLNVMPVQPCIKITFIYNIYP